MFLCGIWITQSIYNIISMSIAFQLPWKIGQIYKKQKISIVYASEACVMIFQWPNHDIKILGLAKGLLPLFYYF